MTLLPEEEGEILEVRPATGERFYTGFKNLNWFWANWWNFNWLLCLPFIFRRFWYFLIRFLQNEQKPMFLHFPMRVFTKNLTCVHRCFFFVWASMWSTFQFGLVNIPVKFQLTFVFTLSWTCWYSLTATWLLSLMCHVYQYQPYQRLYQLLGQWLYCNWLKYFNNSQILATKY